MNLELIVTITLCLFMTAIVETQILKKHKKRDERDVQRIILKKTDQKVSETTENAINSIIKKMTIIQNPINNYQKHKP